MIILGNGLLNVEKLFDYLKTYQNEPENQMRFAISAGIGNKGIHMRSGLLNKSEEFNITVEPLMFNEKYAGNCVTFHSLELLMTKHIF